MSHRDFWAATSNSMRSVPAELRNRFGASFIDESAVKENAMGCGNLDECTAELAAYRDAAERCEPEHAVELAAEIQLFADTVGRALWNPWAREQAQQIESDLRELAQQVWDRREG